MTEDSILGLKTRAGGPTGIEIDAEGVWYYDTAAGIRIPYGDYVAITAPLRKQFLDSLHTRRW